MKKKIRPEVPAKKIILLRFCPKKYLGPDQKPKPPPLNIKWTVPYKSIALAEYIYVTVNVYVISISLVGFVADIRQTIKII